MKLIAHRLSISEKALKRIIDEMISVETIDVMVEQLRGDIMGYSQGLPTKVVDRILDRKKRKNYKGFDREEYDKFEEYLIQRCCDRFRERWEYYNSNKVEIPLFENKPEVGIK